MPVREANQSAGSWSVGSEKWVLASWVSAGRWLSRNTRDHSGSAKAATSSLTLGDRIELPPATKTTYCLPLYS